MKGYNLKLNPSNKIWQIESLEKISALGFFIFRNSQFIRLSVKSFSFFNFFSRIFREIGDFGVFPFFFFAIKNLILEKKEGFGNFSLILTTFLGIGVRESFRRNWNLEKIQFFLFGFRKFLKKIKGFNFQIKGKARNFYRKVNEIFFSNCPKTDLKSFQHQISFFQNSAKFLPEFYSGNLSFFKEIFQKTLNLLFCFEFGNYLLQILKNNFSKIKNHLKEFLFFRATLDRALQSFKYRQIRKNSEFSKKVSEKLIWINKKKKIMPWKKIIKIRRIF